MDQTQDLSGRQLHRLTKLYKVPDFVKKASQAELAGEGLLPPEAYGDPIRHLFPCHTAAATWTSLAFFLDKKAEFRTHDAEMVEERILRSGRLHGISGSLEAVKAARAADTPDPESALADDDFALVWSDGDSRHRRYPMRNALEVKRAAEYLLEHRDRLPFEARRAIADKVLQKQAEYGATLGAELEDYVERQAGHGAGDAKSASELIVGRVNASRKGPGVLNELQEEMLKLAEVLREKPLQLRAPGMRVKVAGVIDRFDREAGLVGQYGPDFPRVEDVLFELTREKMAAAASEHVGTVTGSIYKLADLERVRLSELRDYFGDEFASRVSSDGIHLDGEKAASLIQTLPRSDAVELERLLDGFGIRPVAKEAAACAVGIDRDFLKELAGHRRTGIRR